MGKYSGIHNFKYHLVWCPKRRASVLVGDIAVTCGSVIKEVCTNLGVSVEDLEVAPDHVHLFISTENHILVKDVVKKIKGSTSNILRQNYPQLRRLPCLWSSSYYAGTIGSVSENIVKMYIENQKGK